MKPGQFATIHNTLYRCTRGTNGCEGCDLNSIKLCPNIVGKGEQPKYDCNLSGIIFKKV